MTTLSYFSSPFNGAQHTDQVQLSFFEKARKRKRVESEDSVDDFEITEASASMQPAYVSHQWPYTSADEQAKENILTGEDRGDGKFPHAPSRPQGSATRSIKSLKLTKELACLNPALYIPSNTNIENTFASQQSGLKQQHLTVLTTMMHRCLMKGDYIRAGRAWGMLLRAEIKGRPMDLRSNGLWGLGAEILLHRDAQMRRIRVDRQDARANFPSSGAVGSMDEVDPTANSFSFTPKGFEDAKRYYMRLISQYPWNKRFPGSLSELHFYPAMVSLWISFVQDRDQAALKALSGGSDNRSEEATDSEDSDVEGMARREEIRDSTLHSAQEIAESLDSRLKSLPFSDDASLRNLRGMVEVWIRDLCN